MSSKKCMVWMCGFGGRHGEANDEQGRNIIRREDGKARKMEAFNREHDTRPTKHE